jgi:hypothetical protein
VDKAFTAPLVELALASYPGFTLTAPPARATPYGVSRAASVPRDAVHERVELLGTGGAPLSPRRPAGRPQPRPRPSRPAATPEASGRTCRMPLGRVAHARSGDKGGDANVGVWAVDAADRPDRVVWLLELLSVARVRELLPETAGLEVEVHPLPDLGGVNVVVHGLLGAGVAASSRFDPQAKALGEWLRSRHVEVPEELT